MYISRDYLHEIMELNNELIASKRELERKNAELERAMNKIKQLESIIPICSYCNKIRDDDNSDWISLEDYISSKTDSSLSHGICNECLKDQLHRV